MVQIANHQEFHQLSFLRILSQEIQSLRENKRFGQALRIESARNSFVRFLLSQATPASRPSSPSSSSPRATVPDGSQSGPNFDLTFGELTTSLIFAYQQWLIDTGVVKNSSSCYIRSLQSVYNKATSGFAIQPASPFTKAFRGIAKTRKRAISMAGISSAMKGY